MTETRQPPRFIGVRTYIDPLGRFTFRYPIDWAPFSLPDGRDGIMWGPNDEDPHTWFAVWVTQLDEHVVAEDMEDLRAGLEEGLNQLPDFQLETSADDLLSDLIKFERVFTFTEEGQTRKRKQWVLYVDTWMMVVMWQGSSPEEYHYWLPMGNYCFATFNLPEALWFATDRDLSGNWKVYEEIRAREAEGAGDG